MHARPGEGCATALAGAARRSVRGRPRRSRASTCRSRPSSEARRALERIGRGRRARARRRLGDRPREGARAPGAVRVIAVPTTYSGSEMTSIYGITDAGEKRTGRDERVRPSLVVYDPERIREPPARRRDGEPVERDGARRRGALGERDRSRRDARSRRRRCAFSPTSMRAPRRAPRRRRGARGRARGRLPRGRGVRGRRLRSAPQALSRAGRHVRPSPRGDTRRRSFRTSCGSIATPRPRR